MNTIKKLAFTLLIASATQICASSYDPVADLTAQAAARFSTHVSDVQPFIQAAFDAGKAEQAPKVGCAEHEAAHMKQGMVVARSLLNLVSPVLSEHAVSITNQLTSNLKIVLEEALHEPWNVGHILPILTGTDQTAASMEIERILSDSTITKPDSKEPLTLVYLMFNFAVEHKLAVRS